MGGASDGPTDCVIQPIDPASEKVSFCYINKRKFDLLPLYSGKYQAWNIDYIA